MKSSSDLTRRDALKLAAGLGLSFSLPAMDLRAANTRGAERPKSLILLWMAGGPSQLETWDPHPGTKIGGDAKAISTSLNGLQISDQYPRMAEQMRHLNVIRSLVSEEGDHERGTYLLKTGYRPDVKLTHPSMGAVLASELPTPKLEIPDHISLGSSQWPGRGGYLGDEFDAFKVYDPGRSLPNLKPRVSDERQQRRLAALDVLSQTFASRRPLVSGRTLHRHTTEQALTMMQSEQLNAFTIKDEPEAVQKAYGDSQFGRGCLVARRLVEQGVRAIEVNLNGFDSHANNHEIHNSRASELDPAFAALVNDLVERDLLDSTLVLCIGEFGRTPKINPLAGRDHWPTGFSCVLGGGGLGSGVVIGATDPTGEKKDPTDPVGVADLFATVFHTLGLDPAEEFLTPIGRPMAISSGTPLTGLRRS